MYSKFIAGSNNFAWKNINVVDLLPEGLTGMEFTINGNSHEYSEIIFELNNLPAGTDVRMRILSRLCEGTQFTNMEFDKVNTRYHYYKLAAGKMCSIRGVPFQKNGDTSTVNVYIKMPNTPNVTYEVAVAQYVNGNRVGRATQVFNVLDERDLAFIGNRNSTEVHKKGCRWIGKMSPKNKVGFRTLEHAHIEGYDNCAECLGGSTR